MSLTNFRDSSGACFRNACRPLKAAKSME
jgi:hypothetical protein